MAQDWAQNVVQRAAKQVAARTYTLLMQNEVKYTNMLKSKSINPAVAAEIIAEAMIFDINVGDARIPHEK